MMRAAFPFIWPSSLSKPLSFSALASRVFLAMTISALPLSWFLTLWSSPSGRPSVESTAIVLWDFSSFASFLTSSIFWDLRIAMVTPASAACSS